MTMAAQPSFEYLLSASTTSLEALQLSRLDQIATLKSQINEAIEALATAEIDIRLTRLILGTRLTAATEAFTPAAMHAAEYAALARTPTQLPPMAPLFPQAPAPPPLYALASHFLIAAAPPERVALPSLFLELAAPARALAPPTLYLEALAPPRLVAFESLFLKAVTPPQIIAIA